MHEQPTAITDENAAHSIAASWRPILRKVVSAFVSGDYQLSKPIEGVSPVPPDVAAHIGNYISGYGEVLVELPEEAWNTSSAQWMGSYWEVLVDLYTEGEGPSDLVLMGTMEKAEGKFSSALAWFMCHNLGLTSSCSSFCTSPTSVDTHR